ncbi:MAG: acyl-CoA dehydratase activase, partial [Chloroflexota bacterium]|nr:acyl-CoA dehydratase activase [Chloroflexota bacterium]
GNGVGMAYYAGVDLGSITIKVALLGDEGLVASALDFAGYDSSAASERLLAETLRRAGLRREDVARLVGTGYGRNRVPGADQQVTEITCHARGAHWLLPATRTVIDIGGQDSKGIALDEQGRVVDFVMNDKCAAGTGRFLEVMARALEVDLESFGDLALQAPRRAQISSTCTVFAESEVISQIASGVPRNEIIAGIHRAIASRIVSMVQKIPIRDVVMVSGGVARNVGLVQMLGEELGRAMVVLPEAQLTGAIGAALIAREV